MTTPPVKALCFKCRSAHFPPVGIGCTWRPPRKTTPVAAGAPVSRSRIYRLLGGTRTYCMDCSVGTRERPILRHDKRHAEFVIKIGKHGETPLCRDCALQFAEDFARELETLIGVDTDTGDGHSW